MLSELEWLDLITLAVPLVALRDSFTAVVYCYQRCRACGAPEL